MHVRTPPPVRRNDQSRARPVHISTKIIIPIIKANGQTKSKYQRLPSAGFDINGDVIWFGVSNEDLRMLADGCPGPHGALSTVSSRLLLLEYHHFRIYMSLLFAIARNVRRAANARKINQSINQSINQKARCPTNRRWRGAKVNFPQVNRI